MAAATRIAKMTTVKTIGRASNMTQEEMKGAPKQAARTGMAYGGMQHEWKEKRLSTTLGAIKNVRISARKGRGDQQTGKS